MNHWRKAMRLLVITLSSIITTLLLANAVLADQRSEYSIAVGRVDPQGSTGDTIGGGVSGFLGHDSFFGKFLSVGGRIGASKFAGKRYVYFFEGNWYQVRNESKLDLSLSGRLTLYLSDRQKACAFIHGIAGIHNIDLHVTRLFGFGVGAHIPLGTNRSTSMILEGTYHFLGTAQQLTLHAGFAFGHSARPKVKSGELL